MGAKKHWNLIQQVACAIGSHAGAQGPAMPLKYEGKNTKTLGRAGGRGGRAETKNVLRQVLEEETQMVDKRVGKCPTAQQ